MMPNVGVDRHAAALRRRERCARAYVYRRNAAACRSTPTLDRKGRKRVFDIPKSALAALAVSVALSFAVSVLIWRRHDPLILKLGTTLVAFLPVIGPLFALWVVSFPDRMHPDLQATYKNTVNVYSVPKESIRASLGEKGRSDAV
jgi:hypothetical protein